MAATTLPTLNREKKMHTLSSPSLRFRASLDTHQRIPYNPNAPRKSKKTPDAVTSTPTPATTSPALTFAAASSSSTFKDSSIFDLLKRTPPHTSAGTLTKKDDSYLGYELWLPRPPKVQKPRSTFNSASLAYIGDCIYELYARRHFLFPPLSIEEYNDRVTAVVRCETQDALLQKLLDDSYLSDAERDVLRWGKNVSSSKTRTKKRAGAAIYNRASSLETLVGYLYLTNATRLDEIMQKLGFSTESSNNMIIPKQIRVGDKGGDSALVQSMI